MLKNLDAPYLDLYLSKLLDEPMATIPTPAKLKKGTPDFVEIAKQALPWIMLCDVGLRLDLLRDELLGSVSD